MTDHQLTHLAHKLTEVASELESHACQRWCDEAPAEPITVNVHAQTGDAEELARGVDRALRGMRPEKVLTEQERAALRAITEATQRAEAAERELADLKARAVILPEHWISQVASEYPNVSLRRLIRLIESWRDEPASRELRGES